MPVLPYSWHLTGWDNTWKAVVNECYADSQSSNSTKPAFISAIFSCLPPLGSAICNFTPTEFICIPLSHLPQVGYNMQERISSSSLDCICNFSFLLLDTCMGFHAKSLLRSRFSETFQKNAFTLEMIASLSWIFWEVGRILMVGGK